ncbi:TPA: hypothetical protein ACH3X1_005847 [Trebouxia sp. C0004]
MCADPIGPGNMLSPSKTPENNWQLMRTQPKLKKSLHPPTRNRQLTIPPMPAKRPKPMVAEPFWTPQPPPATPGAVHNLTTLWSVSASSHSFTAAAFLPNSRLRPLPPYHEAPPLHTSIHTFHTVIHSGTPVTRWVWDSTKRPAYASSLQSPVCDQLLQHSIQAYSMHQLNQADNIFTSARTTACCSAGFCQKHPTIATPHSISAQPTGTKHAAPCIVGGVEQRGATQVRPLPLTY